MVTYRRDYYELGQVSAFVQPGARRISSTNCVTYNGPNRYHRSNYARDGLDDASFLDPGGRKVLLAHSTGRQGKRFAVDWHRRAVTYALSAGATVTFAWH